MDLINKAIKERYGSKTAFALENNYAPKDIHSKINTFKSKFNWINSFLKPLGLKVDIAKFSIENIKEAYNLGREHERNKSKCTADIIGEAWLKADKWDRNIKWE